MPPMPLDEALAERIGALVARQMRPAIEDAVARAGHAVRGSPERALPPAPRRKRFPATVVAVREPSPLLALLTLEMDAGLDYRFQAGQFCQVFGEGAQGPLHRPYSIASPPSALPRIDLAVKDVNERGESGWLHRRRAGGRLEIGPALGRFTFRTPPGATSAFLATGTGVAPFRAMLLDQWDRGAEPEVWLFLGSPLIDALPYHGEFQALERRHPGFHYVPVVSRAVRPWSGPTGHIQQHFLERFAGRTDVHAYLCGVPAMVTDCLRLLEGMGVPKAQVHQERFV